MALELLQELPTRYSGHALVMRLQAVAQWGPQALRGRAVGMALDELKRSTRNTTLYSLLLQDPEAATYTCVGDGRACVRLNESRAPRTCSRLFFSPIASRTVRVHDSSSLSSPRALHRSLPACCPPPPCVTPHTHLSYHSPLACSPDLAWLENTALAAKLHEEDLFRIVQNENVNSIRENLRHAYADLAMHQADCGGFEAAISTWCVA